MRCLAEAAKKHLKCEKQLDRAARTGKNIKDAVNAYRIEIGAEARFPAEGGKGAAVRITFRQSDGGAFIKRLNMEIAAMENRDHNAGICLRCQALKKMNDILERFDPQEWSARSKKTIYCDDEART